LLARVTAFVGGGSCHHIAIVLGADGKCRVYALALDFAGGCVQQICRVIVLVTFSGGKRFSNTVGLPFADGEPVESHRLPDTVAAPAMTIDLRLLGAARHLIQAKTPMSMETRALSIARVSLGAIIRPSSSRTGGRRKQKIREN